MGEEWLKEYSGQTTDELIALASQYRTDSIILAFEQAVDQKAARIGSGGQTAEENVILAIVAFEREVNNGGYDQFFINLSKEYTPVIVDALIRIGRPDVARITQDAIQALGLDRPVTEEAVDRAMESDNAERTAILNECGDRYFDLFVDLSEPLLQFIVANRSDVNLMA
jgi:Domain of unknown function (DUF4375)